MWTTHGAAHFSLHQKNQLCLLETVDPKTFGSKENTEKNEWSWRISLIISLSHNKVLIYCFIFPWEWSGFVCLYYHGLPWTYTYLSRWKSAPMRHWWVRIRSKWTLQTFVTKWIWQVFETLSSMSILLHKIVCAHIKQC